MSHTVDTFSLTHSQHFILFAHFNFYFFIWKKLRRFTFVGVGRMSVLHVCLHRVVCFFSTSWELLFIPLPGRVQCHNTDMSNLSITAEQHHGSCEAFFQVCKFTLPPCDRYITLYTATAIHVVALVFKPSLYHFYNNLMAWKIIPDWFHHHHHGLLTALLQVATFPAAPCVPCSIYLDLSPWWPVKCL